jgi:serine protease Do
MIACLTHSGMPKEEGFQLLRKAVFLIVVLLCLFSTIVIFAESLPDLVERVEPAIVFIQTFDNYGHQLNMGSGFFINPYGELVTCRHVLKDACKASVETSSGQKFWICKVTGLNSELDLVKVQIESPPVPLPYLEISPESPRKGERIFVFGNPRGYRFTVSDGIIAAFHELSIGKTIQVTAAISPGSSGSPVINMKGVVVGVVTCYNDDGQHLNFALPAQLIHTLKIAYPLSMEQLIRNPCDCQVMPPLLIL